MAPSTLCQLPSYVLDHIAYFLGSDPFLGPPAALVPLLLTNHDLNSRLSLHSNPYLYGEIFRLKYDLSAAETRFGDRLTSAKLADELRRRSIVLKRLKGRLDSRTLSEDEPNMSLREVLFTAYTLIVENEGKNIIQLQQYGRINDWIREFWFDPRGSSLAIHCVRTGDWPSNRTETALGMWLFWFLFKQEDYFLDNHTTRRLESPRDLLKAMAFGAHTFGLSTTSWVYYDPQPSPDPQDHFTLYSEEISFTPTPLAIPAILSYFALIHPEMSGILIPAGPQLPHPAWKEWDTEWERCSSKPELNITNCFRPGSIEGIWEGFFMYTEFGAYASVLAGAPPSVVQKSIVARHRQTWKLREYHLLSTGPLGDALPGGDPLRSYFPNDTRLRETKDGLMVQYSGSPDPFHYQDSRQFLRSGEIRVRDVIMIGEGHSAWGQFRLVGRIRPCDGFVSLLKDYSSGGRGQWIYRGYLVGNAFGSLTGRWRDAVTPLGDMGYEGCFVMCRRR